MRLWLLRFSVGVGSLLNFLMYQLKFLSLFEGKVLKDGRFEIEERG
nr:tyrosine/DOPA decarboxylase 1-like [Ipomoea batatas]